MYDKFDMYEVQQLARDYGYSQCQLEPREGVLGFNRRANDGNELVRVWWRTGTVGTYLTHPRQGKVPLFRRAEVTEEYLERIFQNPRVHTGGGYHTREQYRPPSPPRPAKRARTVPCLACGKMYSTMADSVGHFESGSCPRCPGRDNARRAAYQVAKGYDQGGNFTIPRLMIEDGSAGGGGQGWRANDYNYHCHSCQRQFRELSSLMQHQQSRAQCMPASGSRGALQLGYGY